MRRYLIAAGMMTLLGCAEDGSSIEDSTAQVLVRVDSGHPTRADAATDEPADAGTDVPDSQVDAADAAAPDCRQQYFRDRDGDGFGDPTTSLSTCDAAPAGFVLDGSDCYDESADVRPNQTARFDVHRGDGSFDYDCDGVGQPMSTKIAGCPEFTSAKCAPDDSVIARFLPAGVTSATCDYREQAYLWRHIVTGWYGLPPKCGAVGLQNKVVAYDASTQTFRCDAPDPTWTRVQECR